MKSKATSTSGASKATAIDYEIHWQGFKMNPLAWPLKKEKNFLYFIIIFLF